MLRPALGQPRAQDRIAPRLGAAFLLGAALGTALDAVHAYGDVESYPHPELGRLGWFVPVEFGLAGIAVVLAIPVLERAFGPDPPPRWAPWERFRELPLLAGLYMASVAANGSGNTLLLVVLLLVVAARLVFVPTKGDWAFALVAAIAGPAVEAAIHALGAFDYTEPNLLGLPIWLAGLWANGGLAIRRLFGPLALPLPVPEPHEAAERTDIG